ncbi:MAG: NADH-quinone oxidoreductase subunit H [Vicinamibacteria bacterium]|jgi:formate hydrogenlyase subunit 4|nr:NADH-quinone oxidoreductase subunit H [Vicinamibacteria bacterium]
MALRWLSIVFALILAPSMMGVIARVKAVMAGRRGAPLLQPYYDIAKLLRKGAVYSETTTAVFRFGPLLVLATTLMALGLVPFGKQPAPLGFTLDFLVIAYLLALGRFFMIGAALDTGSSFAGMGASREAHFSALAEPVLIVGFLTLARKSGALSLSQIVPALSPLSPEVILVALAFGIIALSENARVPFDDPSTHLELTMVHEAMILDHGGVDLAFLHYAAALKLWLWGALVMGLLVPALAPVWQIPLFLVFMALAALLIGLVESIMARLRLSRVPSLIASALALIALAFILVVR